MFGRRLREERKLRDWTLEDLGERCALAWNYIADVERGERNVTIDTAAKLAGGLGVPLWQLLRSSE
ncbi:XRE family transcriptional regulator [Deinococcus cavernae]|uniref:XRE family transcriptional regulator n=2 Tax=Deinococcus cavernae TaxID=2320857 RepID=A0A418VHI6_9DEIO|nr:XRE family transcriptional regulator [Deinococcus cavernae]